MTLIQLSGTEASWARNDAEGPILGKTRERRTQAVPWEPCPLPSPPPTQKK